MIQTILAISEFATKLVAGLSGVVFGALILGLVVGAKTKNRKISTQKSSNEKQKSNLSRKKKRRRNLKNPKWTSKTKSTAKIRSKMQPRLTQRNKTTIKIHPKINKRHAKRVFFIKSFAWLQIIYHVTF